MTEKQCAWNQDGEDGNWNTACNHIFAFIDGGPAENSDIKFCCFCGSPIEFVPWALPIEDQLVNLISDLEENDPNIKILEEAIHEIQHSSKRVLKERERCTAWVERHYESLDKGELVERIRLGFPCL